MKSLFKPFFVNDPHQDPGLLIKLFGRKDFFIIDLGDISRLTVKTILKISRVFITHTHIDHFFGFDGLLRTSLSKKEPIHIYGPKGIIKNVYGKLLGYTWNLITEYPISINVHEISKNFITTYLFSAQKKFKKIFVSKEEITNSIIYEDQEIIIKAIELDHKIPVLAYYLKEKKRVNVKKDVLNELCLKPGPWLSDLKKIVISDAKLEDTLIKIPDYGEMLASELAKKLLIIKEGESIVYITDIVYSKKNLSKITNYFKEPDILFCEAFFTTEDINRAKERYHLTAKQAREISEMIRAKKLIIFHFSPRYKGNFSKIYEEAGLK
ncbi:MAG: MBL fold metallo-hydrolase [Proteobacteria bacterium]|nr:MBL fold metallo-hydrolase [Pseudomonadota bacterium]